MTTIMKKNLRILFTNNKLSDRAGSELVVLDLATEFRRRGHFPVAYSSVHGRVADELRQACIPVVSDLSKLGEPPDIIHGQHHIEAMTAMLHFPGTPAIYACLGWLPWQESPPKFSNIRKYIAVGELTRESIVTSCAIPRDDIAIIPNFVDLKKFGIKKALAKKPLSAAIFDNTVTARSGYAQTVRMACQRANIPRIDVIGIASGNASNSPEKLLGSYDIVFAVGRSALEAMCMGCAVIVSNPMGAHGMIVPENVDAIFGRIGLSSLESDRLNANFLYDEILKFTPERTLEVTRRIREKVDLKAAADRYEAIYHDAMADWDSSPPSAETVGEQFREIARYITSLKPMIQEERLKQEILQRHSMISTLKNHGISFRPPDKAAR